MFKRTLIAGLLAAMLVPSVAVAQPALPAEPANFTLQVALASAIRHNPNIQVAQAKLEQAKLDKQEADLWWAQAVNANANYVIGGQPGYGGGTVTATGTVLPTAAVGVGLNLGNILNGPKNSAKAEQAVTIAEADLRRTTLEVASQVTAAYTEYQAAKQVLTVAPEVVSAAETDVRIIERQFASGNTQVNSLLGARLTVARAKSDSFQVAGNVAKSWTNLLNLMGDQSWLPTADGAN